MVSDVIRRNTRGYMDDGSANPPRPCLFVGNDHLPASALPPLQPLANLTMSVSCRMRMLVC